MHSNINATDNNYHCVQSLDNHSSSSSSLIYPTNAAHLNSATITNRNNQSNINKLEQQYMFIIKQEFNAGGVKQEYQVLEENLNDFVRKLSDSHHQTDAREVHAKGSNATIKADANESVEKVRPYFCTECGKSFIQKHHLTTHVKVHSGIKSHMCNECGKSFTHKHCLNTHMLLHSSERPYQCTLCKKSFTLKHHLLSHSKVHTREKPHTCNECGLSFPLKRHLVTHGKFHAGKRPFICEECGESFALKEHLMMHSRFHGFVNSFACTNCNATFTRKFELVNHSKLHGNFPLKCSVCGKEFIQKRTFIAHMRYHSEERKQGKMSFTCSQCNCSFNNEESLALHIKLHTGNPSLAVDLYTLTKKTNFYSAEFHSFTNNSGNNNAVKRVKTKSYYCKFCLRAFSAKHGMQQHNNRHPEGTCAIRTHVCPTCNKGFFQKNHLMLHQRQHGKKTTQP